MLLLECVKMTAAMAHFMIYSPNETKHGSLYSFQVMWDAMPCQLVKLPALQKTTVLFLQSHAVHCGTLFSDCLTLKIGGVWDYFPRKRRYLPADTE